MSRKQTENGLTPTEDGYADRKLGCYFMKDKHHLLEYEQRYSCHPQYGHQCEVMYEDRHCHTTSIGISGIIYTQGYECKGCYQHKYH